jgi:PKD repeat protein
MRKVLLVSVLLACFGAFFPDYKGNATFTNGMDASVVQSAPGFNDAGYLNAAGDGLLFNHPMNIAVDGTHLLLADTRNNRILIWNTPPVGNVSPDIVLGQDNFTTNDPGATLNRLNWPVGLSAGNGKIVVSDTYNHRILIWNSFPGGNAQPADLFINNLPSVDPSKGFGGSWPWGVWTDGTKLVVCLTAASQVWIWNNFPTANNQQPDVMLTGKDPASGGVMFASPASISTDGRTYLIVGENASDTLEPMSMVWRSFPTSDQPYAFKMPGPGGQMTAGQTTQDGSFVTLSEPFLAMWNAVPSSSEEQPALIVYGYNFQVGNGSKLVIAPSGYVYISLCDGNKVVGYYSLPTSATQLPDFAIGSPDIQTNTFRNAFINNPVPATNLSNLIVTSGSDHMLDYWGTIPTQDNVKADNLMLTVGFRISANAIHGDTFIAAGNDSGQRISIWKSLPPWQASPYVTYAGNIGTASFQNIQGVALDEEYLYVSDSGKIFIWQAFPAANTPPLITLDVPGAGRISSDGRYLAIVDSINRKVKIYDIGTLASGSVPVAELPAQGASYKFAGASEPVHVLAADDYLFVSDPTAGRVLVWKSIGSAVAGSDPDAVLGQPDLDQGPTEAIGVDRLFWPGDMAFDGNRLWVGEFKYSSRLLGFLAASEILPAPSKPLGPALSSLGDSLIFTSSSGYGQPVQYQFDWQGDESDLSSWGAATQSHAYRESNKYLIRARVRLSSDISIVSPWSDYHAVTVGNFLGDLRVDFTATPTSGKQPLKVTFTDKSDSRIRHWYWDFGNGKKSREQNPTVTYTQRGSYSVTLTGKIDPGPGGWGGGMSENTMVKTNFIQVGLTQPVAAFRASYQIGQAPFSVLFTDYSTGDISSFAWDFGDGATSTEQNPDHTYFNPGVYSVKLTVTGSSGRNTVTKAQYIKVTDLQPIISFTGTPTTGCAPLAVRFTDTSTGNPTKWYWDFGDGKKGTGKNPAHTYSKSGSYSVALAATGSGGNNDLTMSNYITVYTAPKASFKASPSVVKAQQPVQFMDTSQGDITERVWDFGDGTAVSAEHDPAHTFAAAGTYAVKLTVSGHGKTSIKTIKIKIKRVAG